MTEQQKTPAPKGLGMVGRRLWRRVCEVYLLRVDEQIVLEHACRTLDTIALIDAAMVDQPLMVKGSMGQMREHPLLSERRQQQALLARLLRQIALPDEDAAMPGRAQTRSVQARDAALSRWGAAYGTVRSRRS